jgi:ABC-2 type transport system ATP-binding protein
MTVHEYLDFFAAAYGQSLKQRDRVLGEVLALTDLGPRRDSLVASLSRGLQQRVGLARVLLNDPDLLLLDEPAAGLDPRARIELMEMLRALRGMGKSIVISSHILGELGDLCDAVTIIDRGSIRYTGSMRDLLELQQSRRAFRLRLADPPADVDAVLASLPDVVGVERVEEQDEFRVELAEDARDANRLLRAMLERGLRVQQIAPDRKQLHQVFLDLTTAGVS